MLRENAGRSYKLVGIIITLAIILALGVAGFMLWQQRTKKPVTDKTPEKSPLPVKPQPVIDYDKLEKDKNLKALMKKRCNFPDSGCIAAAAVDIHYGFKILNKLVITRSNVVQHL